jgi:2-aminoethylphosphonate-pyruvate transaminase
MLRDFGSRDARMIDAVREIRSELLHVAGVSKEEGWEAVIMQGSGTFTVESVLGTSIPREGAKLLVVVNGAYGRRIVAMATALGIPHSAITFEETSTPTPEAVAAALESDPSLTHMAIIHHETTTGIINPIETVSTAARAARPGLVIIVDSMSAFGALPVDLKSGVADYLVSSANKNIEGVPGFAFALCRRALLEATEGNARSVSLDLYAQWAGLEKNGQFRFTPPTHAMLAFRQALKEFALEGGAAGRLARYKANYEALIAGMSELGFKPLLPAEVQSPIIITFPMPDDPKWDFARVYDGLADLGFVLYPGKVAVVPSFRIGCIGRMFPRDMRMVVAALRSVLAGMGVVTPVHQKYFD